MIKLKILTIVIAFSFAISSYESTPPQNKKPNIILIMSDDMSYSDIGSYGGVIKWNGVVYHFYNAVGDSGRVIALATSKDLRK